jgi:flagellar hook-associated protein 1 FlgK
MSLSAAFNIISSSFAANSAQTAVVSNNIANVNTSGYSREVVNLVTNLDGGVDVASVTRIANAALAEQVATSTAEAAAQQAIANGLATLAITVDDSSSTTSSSGTDQNGASPSAMLANLESALTTYQDSPTSSSAADAAVTAAQDLAQSLNAGAAAVNQVREQADQDMASSVSTINSLLAQFQTANDAVVSGLGSGADVATAEDTRDSLVTQLAKQIGVTTTTASNGSMSIYADNGVLMFQDTPQTVSFTQTSTYADGVSGSAVTVGGVPITGTSSAIQSGALAGYAALRDTIAPQYEAQLDQIAGGLINAFAETPQSGSGNSSMPGLFATQGATSLPSTSDATGLAAAIEVNPAVVPSQGGNAALLRDGGINGADYVYNTTGASSYTTRLQQMVSATGSTQSFDASAGLGTSASLTDYANASVSWLQARNQQASNASDYQNALVSQATSALSNATGVNLDSEMTNMLNLENTYASTAKLLTTIHSMFSALLEAA